MDYFDTTFPALPMPSFSRESSLNPGGGLEEDLSIFQEPTPIGTPFNSEPMTVPVSTAFHPAAQLDLLPPDIVLRASDHVFFHAHRHRLLAASDNGFDSLLADSTPTISIRPAPVVPLPETSDVINVLLHTFYDLSCAPYNPSVAVLIATVTALKKYGISPSKHVTPNTPLFPVLLAQAPMHGIELYMVAAENDLHDLAVAVSPHLLSFPLSTVTDEMAARMGPLYLKKLFFLHINRTQVIQKLMLTPPACHAPTLDCGMEEQQRLMRAWALACASLAWDARPDLSTAKMEAVLGTLDGQITCDNCKTSLYTRIQQLTIEWKNAQRTI